MDDLDRARAVRVAPQVALALERHELVLDRRRAGQADGVADLAHARRVAALLDAGADGLEHEPLTRGEAVAVGGAVREGVHAREVVPVPRRRGAARCHGLLQVSGWSRSCQLPVRLGGACRWSVVVCPRATQPRAARRADQTSVRGVSRQVSPARARHRTDVRRTCVRRGDRDDCAGLGHPERSGAYRTHGQDGTCRAPGAAPPAPDGPGPRGPRRARAAAGRRMGAAARGRGRRRRRAGDPGGRGHRGARADAVADRLVHRGARARTCGTSWTG